MRLEYDPQFNIAYLRFLEDCTGDLQTLHISEELNIDLLPDGRLFGIELLNANEQLFQQDAGQLVIENKMSGKLEIFRLSQPA
jgi:uncharacterized protein YuzE